MIGLFAAHVQRTFEAAGPLLLWGLAESASKRKPGGFALRVGREASLVGRLLLLSVASRALDVPASHVRLGTGPYGKPYIIGAEDLHFSISYGGRYAVLAMDGGAVGVDIERIRDLPFKELSAAFSPPEIEDIERFGGEARAVRLLELWTLKESYLKAIGSGLTVAPESLVVSAPCEGTVALGGEVNAASFQFRQYRLAGDHLVALCSRSETFPPTITEVDAQSLRAVALMLHIEEVEADQRRHRAAGIMHVGRIPGVASTPSTEAVEVTAAGERPGAEARGAHPSRDAMGGE